ncbi:hypothetical protein Acr_03g0014500 [Actinidia rufa]|uniref:Uncharacterized protein n=1 Tax=Actinidia rufa TaxID=165716 RepID=A0A7J0EES9_9ERIC|nr:hypothetical protein Acr_03g0014500 [Actinidia rufa]
MGRKMRLETEWYNSIRTCILRRLLSDLVSTYQDIDSILEMDKDYLKGGFLEENLGSLRSCSGKQAPSSDGMTDFFLATWHSVKDDIEAMFCHSTRLVILRGVSMPFIPKKWMI